MIRLSVCVVALGIALACAPERVPAAPTQPTVTDVRDRALTAQQQRYIDRLRESAREDDVEAVKAAGLGTMRFALSGVVSLQAEAEKLLERAFSMDPDDPEVARSLGRFYNMRSVAGDFTKAQMQVKVYRALLGDRAPEELSATQFIAHSFATMGAILVAKNDGRMIEALRLVKRLEATLAARVASNPDDVELRALAGNFAFFFAGNLPTGKQRRVATAVRYFEALRAEWDRMRPGAKDPYHCPNTYENFMFELAEGLVVLDRVDEARPIYEELTRPREPMTRAKELIAWVSAERLRNAPRYVGNMKLMPPWPSDVANCVVCHSWTADVSLATFHSVDEVPEVSRIPTRAIAKPVEVLPPDPTGEMLRADVFELLDARCRPCHFPGGRVHALADFTNPDGVRRLAPWIARRVAAGEMPPTGRLSPSEIELIQRWAESP